MTPKFKSVVYGSHTKKAKIGYHTLQTIRGLLGSHYLAYQLTKRDIAAQYRQSILGLLWAFIIPVANTVVWILLQGSGVVNLTQTGLPYPIYVFSGTMIWAIFMDSLNGPLEKTNLNKAILTKVNFNREALLLSGIYQSVFNASIKIIIVVAFLWFMGYPPTFLLFILPLAVIGLIICGTAIGLLLTPVGMLYSDISKGLPLVMQFLMYSVPVVFIAPTEGLMAKIVGLNPLTPLITVTRNLLTGNLPDMMVGFGITVGAGTLILLMGLTGYRIAIPILIERMNA